MKSVDTTKISVKPAMRKVEIRKRKTMIKLPLYQVFGDAKSVCSRCKYVSATNSVPLCKRIKRKGQIIADPVTNRKKTMYAAIHPLDTFPELSGNKHPYCHNINPNEECPIFKPKKTAFNLEQRVAALRPLI